MNVLIEEARAALWAVWNRRWLALAVAWGVCLLGWLAVALIPNSYESKARMFVQLDDMLADQIGIGADARKQDIERMRQTLVSATNLEKIVRSTRIGDTVTSPGQMERAVASLGKDIKLVCDEKNVCTITVNSGRSDFSDGENAQLAQDVALRLIDIARESNLGGSRGEMRETIEFLDQQLGQRQRQLEDAEQRRLAFEAEHPELIGGPATITAQLSATRSELRGVEADLAAAESAFAALQRQIASLRPQASGPNADVGGTANPAWSSLQAMRVERQSNVMAQQSRAAALRSEIAAISANQATEPAASAEAQRISRDYEVLRKQYDELLQDREELRLRGQVETERSSVKFDVVDPPNTPRVPAAPNRPLLLFGVLFVGVAAGCGVAYGVSKVRATFATASKLETTFGLPVIGTISLAMTDAGRALARKKRKLFLAASGSLGGLFVVLLAAEFVQRGMVA